ncbi:YjbF family lipoprotein [Rhodoferax sp. PAMC 29310]|uniref:YjbF family lipoprotein n=1 Tax=Rhodoferax sp. PAMC 29310 TaxID=2822760 RepID=UPI001B330907|nr:YjbF family lipoprotein [Rhodoferax sp. PAMC 29310]
MAPTGAILFLKITFPQVFLSRVLLGVVAVSLLGCAGNSSTLSQVFSAVVADQIGASDAAISQATLNPQYQYLRVDMVGRKSALLVLGYVDPHPAGDVEVWYSSVREVIKTQNGRIIGTAGLGVDWRSVRYDPAPPPWASVLVEGANYARSRDMMPGYQHAVVDLVQLKPWFGREAPIQGSKLATLPDKSRYHWFSEESKGQATLPLAWYVVGPYQGRNIVVYSEQCLTASFCLKLTRWPQ